MELIKLTCIWIVIWSGIALTGFTGWELYHNVQEHNQEQKKVDTQNEQTSNNQLGIKKVHADWRVTNKVPTELELPSLAQNLQIVPNEIVNGQWQISEKYANYLIGSGVIGHGNMVIYAHKRRGMFLNLHNLQIGDTIRVRSADVTAEYQVQSMMIVDPSRTDILDETDQNIVTLYTCDGWQDTHRLVVRGKLIHES